VELNQMLGLELAARPAVSVCKLHSHKIARKVGDAVSYQGFATALRKLKRYHGARRDRILHLEAGAAGRNILESRPLRALAPLFKLPADLHQIGAQVSILLPISHHDLSIGIRQRWFRFAVGGARSNRAECEPILVRLNV